jgi:ribonuclease R
MGRAFRVVKRTAHLTVKVAERPVKIAVSADEAPGAAPKRKTAASKAGASRKAATPRKAAASRGSRKPAPGAGARSKKKAGK